MRGLDITTVDKAYGARRVLCALSLTIPGGSFTAVLGPSGSGKTTLLRLIAGFERVDGGTIRLGDEIVDDGGEVFVSPARRRVGYVPQEGGLFPHLSVQKNVAFGLPREERRGAKVDELLELVGLAGFARRFPYELSGGQQQRVALARALAIRPEIVLLDEPFSSLDASLRASLRRDVRRVLRDQGATTVLVTHDQDEALSLADTVAIMRDGHIGQRAAPRELYLAPSNAEIAHGLGGSNLLPAVARGNEAESPAGIVVLRNGPIPDGTRIRVLVRPEQLRMATEPTTAPAIGHVVDAEYYGHDGIVWVRPSWDANSILELRVSDATGLPTIGTEVGLRVRGPVIGWPDDDTGVSAERAEQDADLID